MPLRDLAYDTLQAGVEERRKRLRSILQEMQFHREKERELGDRATDLQVEIAELELAQDGIVEELMR
jgi:septal ring factor EnvC (AmiA/AmiB activator)